VHLARVDGERVVVKVQRPYLKEIFDVDLKNIRVLAQILQNVDPKSDGAARDWVAIYDECSRILYQVCTPAGNSVYTFDVLDLSVPDLGFKRGLVTANPGCAPDVFSPGPIARVGI
jgi:hypothetical protein